MRHDARAGYTSAANQRPTGDAQLNRWRSLSRGLRRVGRAARERVRLAPGGVRCALRGIGRRCSAGVWT
jgi:hypothetical protein